MWFVRDRDINVFGPAHDDSSPHRLTQLEAHASPDPDMRNQALFHSAIERAAAYLEMLSGFLDAHPSFFRAVFLDAARHRPRGFCGLGHLLDFEVNDLDDRRGDASTASASRLVSDLWFMGTSCCAWVAVSARNKPQAMLSASMRSRLGSRGWPTALLFLVARRARRPLPAAQGRSRRRCLRARR